MRDFLLNGRCRKSGADWKMWTAKNATMYVLVGGVLGVLSAVIHIVALVISYKRYCY